MLLPDKSVIAVFGLVTLCGVLDRMQGRFGPFNLRAVGVVMIATFATLLALKDGSSFTAAMEILGAIAVCLDAVKLIKDTSSLPEYFMSSQQSDYKITVMSRDEVQIAVDLASIEGWNPGLCDADCFYAADPQGFFVGKINSQPVSTISAVKYGTTFGFIGLYIVEQSFRQKGYGIQIWHKAIDDLRGRTIGLDGVVAQQENYKKSGFELAHRNIRFAGLSKSSSHDSSNIVDLSTISFADLAAYDRNFFPERRDSFLKAWINQPNCHALGIVENSKLCGYGVIRACQTGYKIGPLNAETQDLAAELFNTLISKIPPNSAVYLDTPEPNPQAIELAQSQKMELAFETARMYRGAFPEISLSKVFGITSFELG